MNKLYSGKPEYLKEYLVPRQQLHNLSLRNLNKFNIFQHKTAKFQCCYAYLSVDWLNNAEYYEMIVGVSIDSFKVKYKNYLIRLQNEQ